MLESKTLLIGIGAQKAGTTWLGDYFATHPDIYFSPMKELHYFDMLYGPDFTPREQVLAQCMERIEVLTRLKRRGAVAPQIPIQLEYATDRLSMFQGEMPYLDFFDKRVGDQKVFAEITPGYQLLDASVFKIMNDIHPDVRFLFVMRDPIDRSWSQFRMSGRNRDRALASQDFIRMVSRPQMILRSDYKRTIEELEKSVPPQRVKYIFFEDMFTPAAMKDVTDFLGIQEWPADFGQKSNAGGDAVLDPELAKLAFNRFRYVYEYIAGRFPERLPALWRETMARYG